MYTERKTCLLFLQQRWNNSIGELRLRSIFLPQNIFGPHENCFFYFRQFQSPIFRSYRYVKSHQKNSHPNSCNLHVDFSPCKRKYSKKNNIQTSAYLLSQDFNEKDCIWIHKFWGKKLKNSKLSVITSPYLNYNCRILLDNSSCLISKVQTKQLKTMNSYLNS